MARQIYFDDVAEGTELPGLTKHPVPRQMVKWAGASGDYFEIHYDKDFARRQGLPDIIVPGDLTAAFLVQLTTDWMGELAAFKKIRTTNLAMLFPDEDVICKGKVSKKYVQGDDHLVECEVWAENPRGEKCVVGSTLVVLPVHE
jgi:acyl dehydratase